MFWSVAIAFPLPHKSLCQPNVNKWKRCIWMYAVFIVLVLSGPNRGKYGILRITASKWCDRGTGIEIRWVGLVRCLSGLSLEFLWLWNFSLNTWKLPVE
jgi:hypothetical protein